jgi:hypothetical protein
MSPDTLRREPLHDAPTWMLIGRGDEVTDTTPMSKRAVLTAVARRGGPRMLEATLIPALLFFVAVLTMGPVVAMVVVLAWGYGAIVRRLARGEAIPAILALATLGLTVKTLVGLASGSTFAYFVQPVATTVVLAFVFLGSVVIGRPMVARLAHDFCPLAPDIASRLAVARMFSGLTVLWAVVHIVIATATFAMLVSLPVATFVALKTATSFSVTGAAIAITVTWALRIANTENLVLATI